jgi:hypothetical protein
MATRADPTSVALLVAPTGAGTSLAGARQQFQEQIDFFLAKLNLPSDRWDDIKGAAHDRAFIVAGATKADLLNDLRLAVEKSIRGASIGDFRKDFAAAVQKSGWSGWTGQGTKAGEAWRTRVIYQTNMATSYAAGRWKQLNDPELLKVRPFWRYIHSDSVISPRPQHKAWGDSGLTLRYDHPFWQTHFPPNGWGCHCTVQAVRGPKAGDATEPPAGWDTLDPKTGAPVGIDKGWAYAPGAHALRPLQDLIDAKLITLDAPIGAAMWDALKPALARERLVAWQKLFDATRQAMQATGNTTMVHTVAPDIVAALAKNNVVLENAAVWMRDTELLHALRDYKSERGAALPDSVWRDLPTALESATPYLDTQNNTLVYTIDLGEKLGKVVIRVNYNAKGQFDSVRAKLVSNFAITGGVVDVKNILTDERYLPLKK